MADGRPYPPETYVILFPKVMGCADRHCNGRTDGRCQRRSGKPQFHWKHKNIVKHNIEKTCGNRPCHGSGGSLVISCKSSKRIIGHKQRRSDQHDAEIAFSKGSQTCICAKKVKKFLRCKNTCDNKRHTAQNAPENRLQKIVIRILTLGSVDPESGGRTDTDHCPDSIYQSIHRKDQIQNCQAICA